MAYGKNDKGLYPELYAAGYHMKWEVFLHALRDNYSSRNETLTPKEEQTYLDNWLRQHWAEHENATPCPLCQEDIASRQLSIPRQHTGLGRLTF